MKLLQKGGLPTFFIPVILISLGLCFSACEEASDHALEHKHDFQKQFLPKYFQKLYLGMPLEEFLVIDPNAKILDHGDLGFRIVVEEIAPTTNIKQVTYYFDSEKEQALYEIAIQYNNEWEVEKVASQLYGKPNFQKERWRIDIHEAFDLLVWKYESRLLIAGKDKPQHYPSLVYK